MPTIYGESVVMRLLIQNNEGFSLEKLGMPPEMLARFRKLLHRPDGMILVTGPTGSGKTTTLYAALSELNSAANKIITVEDPVEYRLPGINQVQVNEKIDLDFGRVLRSALRQDPDIILVGEMRDHETAQIGLRAAMTGHLVLSTLHTNDAVSSPIRLIDMGVPRFMVAMSLLAVIAQRLVRVVCGSCVEPFVPEPFQQTWLKLELGDIVDQYSFVRGRGCTHCNGTGYQGRIGIYELLEMNTELADAANHHDTNIFLKLARQQMADKTLRSSAVAMVIAKRTTIAEAMRISNQFEE
jgi:MSHA biogenesis protein MshE